jgi:hypothetical protein
MDKIEKFIGENQITQFQMDPAQKINKQIQNKLN